MVSMVKGISVVARCTNCGWEVVSAGGYPPACHEDKDVYALLIHRPDDKKKVVQLAVLLSVSALELMAEFQSEIIERRYSAVECLTRFRQIKELGVECETDPAIIQKFKRIVACEYAGKYDARAGSIDNILNSREATCRLSDKLSDKLSDNPGLSENRPGEKAKDVGDPHAVL